jgi:hypothetical protein
MAGPRTEPFYRRRRRGTHHKWWDTKASRGIPLQAVGHQEEEKMDFSFRWNDKETTECRVSRSAKAGLRNPTYKTPPSGWVTKAKTRKVCFGHAPFDKLRVTRDTRNDRCKVAQQNVETAGVSTYKEKTYCQSFTDLNR